MMNADAAIRAKMSSTFKLNGLILQRDASTYLVDTLMLTSVTEEEQVERLNQVIDALHRLDALASPVINVDVVRLAVDACRQDNADDISVNNVLTVIDAYTVPKFVYNEERKKFMPVETNSLALYGDPNSKALMFLDRYSIVHQRLLRHDIFRPPPGGRPMDEQDERHRFGLKPIEYLLGTSSIIEEVIVLGMLTQLKEGSYHLEDPTGSIKVDLSDTKFHAGFFAESCFVLAEGTYEDRTLQVKALGFPPTEPSNLTRTAFGSVNFFGGTSKTSLKTSVKFRLYEEANRDASFVFVADVCLDDIKVMNKLRQMFQGFAEFPPTCFVLMGNFTSIQLDSLQQKSTASVAECFTKLAEVILEFPSVASNSKFIIVPGPLDLGLSTVLPRPKIPHSIVEQFARRLPDSVFATNPCRIQYCTQEIVVFREDLMNKMCRNCIHFPDEGDVAMHLARTLLSQSHLCPLPLHISPVYWEYDHALRLYPLPDLLVLGDRYDPYKVEYSDCNVINPGSFSRSGFVFKVYIPAQRQIEDSQIAND